MESRHRGDTSRRPANFLSAAAQRGEKEKERERGENRIFPGKGNAGNAREDGRSDKKLSSPLSLFSSLAIACANPREMRRRDRSATRAPTSARLKREPRLAVTSARRESDGRGSRQRMLREKGREGGKSTRLYAKERFLTFRAARWPASRPLLPSATFDASFYVAGV